MTIYGNVQLLQPEQCEPRTPSLAHQLASPLATAALHTGTRGELHTGVGGVLNTRTHMHPATYECMELATISITCIYRVCFHTWRRYVYI